LFCSESIKNAYPDPSNHHHSPRLKRRQSSYSKRGAHHPPAGSRNGWTFIWAVAIAAVVGLVVYSLRTLVPKAKLVDSMRSMPTPSILKHHCEEHIGPPRVIRVTDTVWVAVGFDLANTICKCLGWAWFVCVVDRWALRSFICCVVPHLPPSFPPSNHTVIKTSEGHVVVDVAMSPFKSRIMRAALTEAAGDAPIHTIVYTHSHIDHVGGASGWAGNGTRIWATDKLTGHFFKQYGVFRKVRRKGRDTHVMSCHRATKREAGN